MLYLGYRFPPLENALFSPSTLKNKKSNGLDKIHTPKHIMSKLYKFQPPTCCYNSLAKEEVAVTLPEGLKEELMPRHVAVIMDGNRRWAEEKGLPIDKGHRAGSKAVRDLAHLCSLWGVKVLTIFAFSTENWKRPKEQVGFLMSLFEEVILADLKQLTSMDRDGIKVTFIGNKSRLPRSLLDLMNSAENATRSNSGLHYMIALNYGGRHDILQATKSIADKVKGNFLRVEDIDEGIFGKELQTSSAKYPDPDLLIRTSGESRISNFMLWQLAYTELYFCEKLFPDFGEEDFVEALKSFQKRERRYGSSGDGNQQEQIGGVFAKTFS